MSYKNPFGSKRTQYGMADTSLRIGAYAKKSRKVGQRPKTNAEILNKKIENVKKKVNTQVEVNESAFGNNNVLIGADTAGTGPATPFNIDLISVPVGTAEGQHIGREVYLTSLDIRFNLRPLSMIATNSTPAVVRVVIIKAKSQVTAIPSLSNIMLPVTNAFFVNSPYNYNYFPEVYKVKYDRTFKIQGNGSTTVITKRVKIPLGMKMKWNTDTTGTSLNAAKNGLFMYAWAEFDTATGSAPRMDYAYILRYKDA